MKLSCLCCATLGVALLTPMLYARNLDDAGGIPGSTVRTELRRGAQEAAACTLKAANDNLVLADCAYSAP
jgi:hypothetical protein